MQFSISERRLLLQVGDACAIFIAALLSLFIWSVMDGTPSRLVFVRDHFYWIPLLIGLWVTIAHVNEFYSLAIVRDLRQSIVTLSLINVQLVLLYIIVFFISPRLQLPRLIIFYYGGLSLVLIMVWRLVLWRLLVNYPGIKRRILVLGAGESVPALLAALNENVATDYEVVGLVAISNESSAALNDVLILGAESELLAIAVQYGVSEIVIARDGGLSNTASQQIVECIERGISIISMPILYERITGRVPIEHIVMNDWKSILPTESVSRFDLYLPLKRFIDIGISLAGLVLFLLVLPFIALAILLDSPGSIFYVQERSGRYGKPFKMIKLRTMITDAEAGGPQWSTENDPRITRVGRFLRRTRLDELPQFVNILRGDMSLVGPRAERPVFVEQLAEEIPFYRTRLAVRPGATGWAQISYKYASTIEDSMIKLQYDLYYIRHQSLAMDLLIILRTLRTVIGMKGQ